MHCLTTLQTLNESWAAGELSARAKSADRDPRPIGGFVTMVIPIIGSPYFLSPNRSVLYDGSQVAGHESFEAARQWLDQDPLAHLGFSLGDEVIVLRRAATVLGSVGG